MLHHHRDHRLFCQWRGVGLQRKGFGVEGGIYLLQDGGLVGLNEQAYAAEELLQKLLADHPNLLAGEQVDATSPRRWLLVTREASVPGEEGGAGRWALDHLFLDQDAVPTLVEVKRSTDTRVRREVVGQMLDYAANAVVYWPVGEILALFKATCNDKGLDPDVVLDDFLGDDADPEAFWQLAKQNLQAGRIRMIFVADQIPPELQRIVEFLNGQMNPAQVLACEVRQFVGQGLTALVPRVVGQTAAAQQAKSAVKRASPRQWNRASFFADAEAQCSRDVAEAFEAILDWADRTRCSISWGKSPNTGSANLSASTPQGPQRCIELYSNGGIAITFNRLKEHSNFESETSRQRLLEQFNALPGIMLGESATSLKVPNFRAEAIAGSTVLPQFLGVLDWMVERLRSADVPS